MRITNKKYNIKGRINTNIILISDIHYYSKNDIIYLNKILNKISKLNANYIWISGDIIDQYNIKDEYCFIDWLKKLSSIAKTIISIGNHEYYIDKKTKKYGFNNKLFNKINNLNNIYLLDNKSVILDNINFIGLTLPIEYYYKYNESYDKFLGYINNINVNKKYYNVLLCHSPVNIINKEVVEKLNVDLILCGHMHGGMMPKIFRPILKRRGLISPSKKLFPKIVYGNIKINNTNIIITSGITVLSNLNCFKKFKNLFSGEIVKIKIYD